ncbi:MAG TPA: lysylphosphatidylglycerol synthase transmembrane domain-containing protein [Pyrinomonadaceae bacterium]|nr:lysylphosphatidylglycerol synthase transmembrane domain-containing protein [Pyrinomonadaceae bacterium]
MKSNKRKIIEFAALCLLAVAILWWFGRKLDWAEVRRAVSHADPYLLGLAVVIISLAYLFRATRWGALLAPLGKAGLRNLFIATTVGFSAVFLFGRAGEVVRPVVLPMREPRIRPAASFVTIMIERLYDSIAVVLLFAVNLLWFRPSSDAGGNLFRIRAVGAGLLLMAIGGVFGLIQFRKHSARALRWLRPALENRKFMPAAITRAVLSVLEQLATALRVLVDARELAITVGWTALVWAGIGFANLLVLRAFGLPFGVTQTIFVLGWSLVGSLVPTPGGAAGAFHAATAAGLIFLGINRETAAAISIVMHLIDFGPAFIFGFYYFVRGDVSLARVRALTSAESVEHAVEDEPISDEIFTQKLEAAAVQD